MADWRVRPLPAEMLVYARSDTHFLLNIYDHLRNALLEHPQNDPNLHKAMREALDLSAETSLKLYECEGYDEVIGRHRMGWFHPLRKFVPANQQDQEVGLVFRRLHAWRDRIARQLDESPT